MDIKLKNIKVAESLSEETIAFTASLYVDGKLIGHCSNRGHGGSTDYYSSSLETRADIERAENYCKTLPKIELSEGLGSIENSLEHVIDDLLNQYVTEKEKARWNKKLEKMMKRSIVVGDDTHYREFSFKVPVSDIIQRHSNPVKYFNDALAHISTKMKAGERVLNTNLPAGVIIPQMAAVETSAK